MCLDQTENVFVLKPKNMISFKFGNQERLKIQLTLSTWPMPFRISFHTSIKWPMIRAIYSYPLG